MHAELNLLDKPVRIDTTARAAREIAQRTRPLRVEMELYFSCMIGKTLRFDEATQGSDFVPAGPNLEIGFRAVQTQACHVTTDVPKPGRVGFPIKDAKRFVPKWLALDFRDGRWEGEFGFCAEDAETLA